LKICSLASTCCNQWPPWTRITNNTHPLLSTFPPIHHVLRSISSWRINSF
jgi:hypothetical protein